MTEQWQELKETITEMRDNDGTGTQQEVCKFLVNYMEILEKQMQEPQEIEDTVSRKSVFKIIDSEDKWLSDCHSHNSNTGIAFFSMKHKISVLPSLDQKPVLDKIRTEIAEHIDKEKLSFGGQFDSGLNLALKIIDKYRVESEDKDKMQLR